MPSVYSADPPAARLSESLDGMALIFHRPSGTTHLLAAPAPEILDALAEGPADAAGVARRLEARFALEGEDAAAEIVAARLEELEAAGLVARA